MKKSDLTIVYKKISDLIPLDKNPRKISDDDFERLRESVEKLPTYFEARPLLVNDESGQLIVYAGNQRLKAAKKLGLKEIPCIVETLPQAEQDERMIRDNIANGEWDFDILADNWSDLDLEGMGLEVDEIEKIDTENILGISDNEEAPSIVKEKSIYKLGDHYLYCGNNQDDLFINLLPQDRHFVLYDPPFEIDIKELNANVFTSKNSNLFHFNKDKNIINFSCNLEFKSFFVADLGRPIPAGNNPYLKHMIISRYAGAEAQSNQNCKDGFHTIQKIKYRDALKNKIHDHEKDPDFISKLIIHYSSKGDNIIDPFSGSGIALLCAQNTRRVCYASEMDLKNCDLIIDRFKKLYPDEPVMLKDS